MQDKTTSADEAIYGQTQLAIDEELSRRISDFLGRKLELVTIKDDE